MENNNNRLLTLKDLVELVSSHNLDLPDVQRGFVWKPWQIEGLWDSILRGFPAGSIIVHKQPDNTLQLLDGQQRTTSIVLGFGQKALRRSTDDIRIFIDLQKPGEDIIKKTGRHYVIRVITKSHPWGYQPINNKKPLDTTEKCAAMNFWGTTDIFKEPLRNFYPWDPGCAPLPLDIFIQNALEGRSVDDLTDDLINWVNWVNNEVKPTSKPKVTKPKVTKETIHYWLYYIYREVDPSLDISTPKYSIDEIYETIKSVLSDYRIPMLSMDLNRVWDDVPSQVMPKSEEKNDTEDEEDETADEENDEIKDDIEEVFVRLNTQGTPLGGEELIYSLIKSKIDKELQEKIENACKGIMKPTRFITLAYRLYENENKKNEISLDMNIKPKQFQRAIKEDKDNKFPAFLQKVLDKELLKNIEILLKYGEESIAGYKNGTEEFADYRLPYPLFIKIADRAREAMFVLMYRLFYKSDKFSYGDDTHRKMVGILLLFMWYGVDLSRIWGAVKTLSTERMWSNLVVDIAFGEESSILNIANFLNKIKDPKTAGQTVLPKKTDPDSEKEIYKKVLSSKDIILYAQRRFIADPKYFDDTLFELDDTNVPFDYDHISPETYIKGKNKNTPPKPLKEIYDAPCNLRAWPYKLNRADQAKIPAEKFTDNDILTDGEILEYSFCSKKWRGYSQDWLDNGKITKNCEWKKMYSLLWERWRDMYEELKTQLLFKELAVKPNNEISHWKDVIKGDLWEKDLKLKEEVEGNYGKNWYRLPIEKGLFFYIYQSDEENESAFQFGVYGDVSLFSNYKDKDKYNKVEDESPINKDKNKEVSWICCDTELPCPYIEGYKDLYKTIKKWLTGLKYNDMGSKTIAKLDKCLIKELLD
jgi:hypothetical protein